MKKFKIEQFIKHDFNCNIHCHIYRIKNFLNVCNYSILRLFFLSIVNTYFNDNDNDYERGVRRTMEHENQAYDLEEIISRQSY